MTDPPVIASFLCACAREAGRVCWRHKAYAGARGFIANPRLHKQIVSSVFGGLAISMSAQGEMLRRHPALQGLGCRSEPAMVGCKSKAAGRSHSGLESLQINQPLPQIESLKFL